MTQYFVICGSLREKNCFAFCNAFKKAESSPAREELLVLPLFFLVPLLQYAVELCWLLVLPLFFLVPLLQYAVKLCWLLVLLLFFLVPLLQYAVKLCQLLVLPLFLLDPDNFSFD